MNENFLLTTKLAQHLYQKIARNLPIIDWHNHLSVTDLFADKFYPNLTKLWIENDPYKHRAMRICGAEEKYITGGAGDYDKFMLWSKTLPHLIGNPLYHWSLMELSVVFGIDTPLNEDTAPGIWSQTEKMLQTEGFSHNGLLKRFHVEYNSPCCTITENINHFQNYENAAPSLRGDNLLCPDSCLIAALSEKAERKICTAKDYIAAVKQVLQSFCAVGCRIADHSLDDGFHYFADDGKNEDRFFAVLQGNLKESEDIARLFSYLLCKIAQCYCEQNMTMLLHLGAQRRTSDRLRRIAGAAGGYAAIGASFDINQIIALLNDIEKGKNGLVKTILLPLNPADSAAFAALSGSYSKNCVRSVVSEGPAWWWCDHAHGIRSVLENVMTYGVLSEFIGMTTDSRSVLSFVRHDYFRRILCNFIGEKVQSGELPEDYELLHETVWKICYGNAAQMIHSSNKIQRGKVL